MATYLWLVGCWSSTSLQHLQAYQDGYRLVTVRTHWWFYSVASLANSGRQAQDLIFHSDILSWHWANQIVSSTVIVCLVLYMYHFGTEISPKSPCHGAVRRLIQHNKYIYRKKQHLNIYLDGYWLAKLMLSINLCVRVRTSSALMSASSIDSVLF